MTPAGGSTKSKKKEKEKKKKQRAKARDDEPEGWGGRRARRGRGDTPAGSQASWLAVPILASDGFCQRGEERVSSSLGHGRIDVLSVARGGVSRGEWRDAERGRKPRTHLHKGWGSRGG